MGIPYDQTLTATGGITPYTWADEFSELPSWATLNPSTGEITGTPDASGTTDFVAQVTDSSSPTPQSDMADLSITVN